MKSKWLLIALLAAGCGDSVIGDLNGTSDNNLQSTGAACTVDQCGLKPDHSMLCQDGKTTTSFTCERTTTGKCGWVESTCPSAAGATSVGAACTNLQCGIKPTAQVMCPDNKSIAGYSCGRDAKGTCGWTLDACP